MVIIKKSITKRECEIDLSLDIKFNFQWIYKGEQIMFLDNQVH